MKVKVAVVIPCYKVSQYILKLLNQFNESIWRIYVVDDMCPENSGDLVSRDCKDSRVYVVKRDVNGGVGSAVITGYQRAIKDGAEIIVKVDGDGQMDPANIKFLVDPIISGDADYTKGNRFYNIEFIGEMPVVRIVGNAALSIMVKASSGYWDIIDPTNGFTAINAKVAKSLPFHKLSGRYFFESDILFRLNILRAKVLDIPMRPMYGDEVSSLRVRDIIFEFLFKNIKNTVKRLFYCHVLRGFSVASIELFLGITLLIFGFIYGSFSWIYSASIKETASAGTVMLSALPIIIGVQLILSFLSYDMSSQPKQAISPFLTNNINGSKHEE